MCGSDFSMMAAIFPGRSRAELKAKFKREDKRNPGQISLALSCQEFDPDEGITSSEDESQPLSICQKKLAEEAEEDRVIFQDGNDDRPPPKKANKPRTPAQKKEGSLKTGTPSASWKSHAKGVRKSDLANLDEDLEASAASAVIGTPKSVRAKKAKLPRNRITTDIFGLPVNPKGEPKPKKKKTQTHPKVKLEKVKVEKNVDEEPTTAEQLKQPAESADVVEQQLPHYLMFVPSDPLGSQVPVSRGNVVESTDEATGESQVTQQLRSPGTFAPGFTLGLVSASSPKGTQEEEENASSSSMSTCSSQNTQQKMTEQQQKVRPPPYRVPGPGGRKSSLIS
jgi:hypothetical protein